MRQTLVVKDIPSYLKHVARLFDRHGILFFRGQSEAWPLFPSIARRPRLVEGYENWKVFQQDLVERFAKHATPFLQQVPRDFEEWIVHGQHNGLPTRLLDWTTNPLKAMFWAVEDRNFATRNGVVWVFAPRYWRDDPLEVIKLSDDELTPYYPKQLNARVLAQEACFVAFPMPPTQTPMLAMESDPKCKKVIDALIPMTIPAISKRGLRIYLRSLGVTHRTLFPDLVGIANAITSELLESV